MFINFCTAIGLKIALLYVHLRFDSCDSTNMLCDVMLYSDLLWSSRPTVDQICNATNIH